MRNAEAKGTETQETTLEADVRNAGIVILTLCADSTLSGSGR